MWLKGSGITPDSLNNALDYLGRLAADVDEDSKGSFRLGVLYFEGKVVKQDLSKAFTYFEFSAKYQHAEAAFYAGRMVEESQLWPLKLLPSSNKVERAKEYYEIAVQAMHAKTAEAKSRLNALVALEANHLYKRSKEVFSHRARYDLLKKAADLGHAKAALYFAINFYVFTYDKYISHFMYGEECADGDVQKYLRLAAENGNAEAKKILTYRQCALEHKKHGTAQSAYALANCCCVSKWGDSNEHKLRIQYYQLATAKAASPDCLEKQAAADAAYRLYELLNDGTIQVCNYKEDLMFNPAATQGGETQRYLQMAAEAEHAGAKEIWERQQPGSS